MRADSNVYQLAASLAATGTGVAIRGGEFAFMANGTVGGATISLQVQQPDGSWCDVGALAGSSIVKTTTLPVVITPIVLPACVVRAAITGGAGVVLNAWLAGIG